VFVFEVLPKSIVPHFLYFSFTRKAGEEDVPMGPPQITAIVAYSKGFACACGPGTVHLFEKTDDKDFFKKAREIKVSNEKTLRELKQVQYQ